MSRREINETDQRPVPGLPRVPPASEPGERGERSASGVPLDAEVGRSSDA